MSERDAVGTTQTLDDDPIAAMVLEKAVAKCGYECEETADYLVETEEGHAFFCCQDCSRQNRIYARENELYKSDVSEEVKDRVLP